eukprot:1159423-Pelagomonas_calceolata.AAC.1
MNERHHPPHIRSKGKGWETKDAYAARNGHTRARQSEGIGPCHHILSQCFFVQALLHMSTNCIQSLRKYVQASMAGTAGARLLFTCPAKALLALACTLAGEGEFGIVYKAKWYGTVVSAPEMPLLS